MRSGFFLSTSELRPVIFKTFKDDNARLPTIFNYLDLVKTITFKHRQVLSLYK